LGQSKKTTEDCYCFICHTNDRPTIDRPTVDSINYKKQVNDKILLPHQYKITFLGNYFFLKPPIPKTAHDRECMINLLRVL